MAFREFRDSREGFSEGEAMAYDYDVYMAMEGDEAPEPEDFFDDEREFERFQDDDCEADDLPYENDWQYDRDFYDE
jgi:hypothetical protein